MKAFEMHMHGKQGDDLHALLEQFNNDIPAALRAWEESFRANAAICARLAKVFEGKKLTALADTHHVSFEPEDAAARECLEVMVAEQLLQVFEEDIEDNDASDE